jgi:hypothetical protein
MHTPRGPPVVFIFYPLSTLDSYTRTASRLFLIVASAAGGRVVPGRQEREANPVDRSAVRHQTSTV